MTNSNRVDVYTDDARRRVGFLGHLRNVAYRWEAGTEVNELLDILV
jgi:hypothetical protein